MIELPDIVRLQVLDKIEQCLLKAEAFFQKKLPRPCVRFDLTGKCAGRASREYVRINAEHLMLEWDDMIGDTVPHEVAHFVVFNAYEKRCTPHGLEWKFVMALFGLTAKRCHSYPLARVDGRYVHAETARNMRVQRAIEEKKIIEALIKRTEIANDEVHRQSGDEISFTIID